MSTCSWFVVEIDRNCGYGAPDWVANDRPCELFDAVRESASLRLAGWLTRVVVA